MASVPFSASAKTYDTEESLATYKAYNECIGNYIDMGNGLYMERYTNIGKSYAVVVTDGTNPADDPINYGFSGSNNWETMTADRKMIETDYTADDPANTYLLSADADVEEMTAMVQEFALKNDYVKEIYLCKFADFVPCSWSKSFTLVVPADVQELDASDFPQLDGLECTLVTKLDDPEVTEGVRIWTCRINNDDAVESKFADAENPEAAKLQYLMGLGDAITADESNPALIAVVDYGFPVSTSYDMAMCRLDSAWEGFGDFDNNGAVNSSDAAEMLIRAASLGAMDAVQTAADLAGDLNGDGALDAADAAAVLTYAAEIGAGADVSWLDVLK